MRRPAAPRAARPGAAAPPSAASARAAARRGAARSAVRPASSAAGPTSVALSPATSAAAAASSRRKATTVMLSRPPASLASRTRRVGGVVQARRAASVGGDLVVRQHRREAVRAQQVDVPRPGLVGHRVHLDLALGPERPGDDRALRMVLGLLVGEPALAAKLLDQRVVGRQQLQLAVAKQVGAAVADVGEARPRRPRPAPRSASSPFPSARSRSWARRWMRALAVRGDRAQVGLGGLARRARRGSNDSAASREATSPAWAPPIPSATANSGGRAK